MLKQVMADERPNTVVSLLEFASLNVLQTKHLPCGGAGLALGQAWVATRMMTKGRVTMPHANMALAKVKFA
jgi:hypothetical protein